MTRSHGEHCASRRDLWLCLARAFAPPAAGSFHEAFARDLPEDLAATGEELGLGIGPEVEAFRAAAGRLGDSLDLQRLYAALFATPPMPVFINTGIYLDGGFLGASELDLESWYRRHGHERHAEFRDLNDHAAVQFEFVALLYDKAANAALSGDDMEAVALATEAERFLHAFPRCWMTAFLQALEQACARRGLNDAFVYLARIAWLALSQTLEQGTMRFEVETENAFPDGSSRGLGDLTAADLAEIALRLEAAGLSYDHVRALPEWQDEALAQRRAEAVEAYLNAPAGSA